MYNIVQFVSFSYLSAHPHRPNEIHCRIVCARCPYCVLWNYNMHYIQRASTLHCVYNNRNVRVCELLHWTDSHVKLTTIAMVVLAMVLLLDIVVTVFGKVPHTGEIEPFRCRNNSGWLVLLSFDMRLIAFGFVRRARHSLPFISLQFASFATNEAHDWVVSECNMSTMYCDIQPHTHTMYNSYNIHMYEYVYKYICVLDAACVNVCYLQRSQLV